MLLTLPIVNYPRAINTNSKEFSSFARVQATTTIEREREINLKARAKVNQMDENVRKLRRKREREKVF